MDIKEFKKKLLSATVEVTPVEFLERFYEMLEHIGLKGCYFNNNSLWIIGKPAKIFEYDGVLFCVHIASGTYRLLGIPVTLDYEKLMEATSMCIKLGLNLRIDKRDLQAVTAILPAHEMNDNYNYHYNELKDYWNTCSRQSKKIHNRLDRQYEITLLKPKEVPVELVARISEINHIWISQFKDNSEKSKQTLSYIDNVFKQNFLLDNARFIFYTNRETGIVEAYDYIEAWGKVGIAAAGKAIIEGCSTFKHVTVNIVKYLKEELGAEYAMLGGSNMYNLDGTVSDPKAGNPGLKVAKTSIPHEVTYTYVYRFNPKAFASIDVSDKSNELF